MNQLPTRILAFRLTYTFEPNSSVVALGAISNIDPEDPVAAVFRLALYDSDANGNPGTLIIHTARGLSATDSEECFLQLRPLAGGNYWLLLLAPDQHGTVHLEGSNVSAGAAPGIAYVYTKPEYSWPATIDATQLVPFPPPPHDATLRTVPHLYVRYLPPQ